MKIVIFAGGVGTRLWPLSRKNTPKQFEKIIGDKSTLQETVERLTPAFSPNDIYIATGKRYSNIVVEQLPQIPRENFIFEPQMRDVGPAIGLAAFLLAKNFPNEPLAILWSDHLVKNIVAFQEALHLAEEMIKKGESRFIFIAQKPRFPNQNIGWIELGEEEVDKNGTKVYAFRRLKYRPRLVEVDDYYHSKKFVWNLGYFVTTPKHLTSLFEKFVPGMTKPLQTIGNAWKTDEFEDVLEKLYPTLEKISFDDAILEKLSTDGIHVISSDLGWSDIGAWEALKEALSEDIEENVTKGNVLLEDSADCLAFNYANGLVVGIDLKEMLVINTGDVILVCPKTSVPKIKKLVESLSGTPHEHLT